jgi:hypothetical protein
VCVFFGVFDVVGVVFGGGGGGGDLTPPWRSDE